jgi:hypothetical protein
MNVATCWTTLSCTSHIKSAGIPKICSQTTPLGYRGRLGRLSFKGWSPSDPTRRNWDRMRQLGLSRGEAEAWA